MLFNDAPPRRVVSLVPSSTGSLFDLGLEQALVGATDYCIYPAAPLAGIPRVGGPKNPRIADILALGPDLVLANREENDRQSIETLVREGVNVWLSFPKGVHEAIDDLWILAHLFRSQQAMNRVDGLEKSIEWAERAAVGQPPVAYFCPVWEDSLETGEHWWMTFNDQTYAADVLRLFSGVNSFANRERRYPLRADLGLSAAEEPGECDRRYPRVSGQEITVAKPDLILLPSEPYDYQEADCTRLAVLFNQTPAGKTGRITLIDGTWIHWPGTRLAQALEQLPAVFNY